MNIEQEQLYAFLRQQFMGGTSEQELREVLKKEGGWSDVDIDEALTRVRLENPSSAEIPTPPVDTQTVVAEAVTSESVVQTDTLGATTQNDVKKNTHKVLVSLVVAVAVVLFAGGAYAFMRYGSFFSQAPYTEENLLSGLVERVAMIDTVHYRFENILAIEDREQGALPFIFVESDSSRAHREAYARDAERMRELRALTYALDDMHTTSVRSYDVVTIGTTEDGQDDSQRSLATSNGMQYRYPERIEDVLNFIKRERYFMLDEDVDLRDPQTGAYYSYRVSESGRAYEIKVTFETGDAIQAIENTGTYGGSVPLIAEKTVTFTQDESVYFGYFPDEQPKPYLVELSENLGHLPGSLNAYIALEGKTDLRSTEANWDLILDGSFDTGDMMMKFAFDARKANGNHYVRVRNIPEMFFGFFSIEKNVWFNITPDTSSEESSEYSGQVMSDVVGLSPDVFEEYEKEKKEAYEFLQYMITVAEVEKVIRLRSTPKREVVDDRILYRYDVRIEESAIVPFMRRVVEEAQKRELLAFDQDIITYLESDEFKQTFAYLDANTSFVLYVDGDGYPARLVYSTRIVPQDSATHLKDKQIRGTITGTFDGIHEPINIEVPEGARSFEDFLRGAPSNPVIDPLTFMQSMRANVLDGWRSIVP